MNTTPITEFPTEEELQALQSFANKYGRSWKRELSIAWETGSDEREQDSHLLRRVRNRCGGRWLVSKLNTIRPQKPVVNTLICGDTMYHLDAAYRAGAIAMREGRRFDTSNPYRCMTTSHDQFDYGHQNENAGEHIRFGVDVIEAAQTGKCFEEDPAVPRDEYGVDSGWYNNQLVSITASQSSLSMRT